MELGPPPVMKNKTMDFLSQFCILPDDRVKWYRKVWNSIMAGKPEGAPMDHVNLCKAIKSLHMDGITDKEIE